MSLLSIILVGVPVVTVPVYSVSSSEETVKLTGSGSDVVMTSSMKTLLCNGLGYVLLLLLLDNYYYTV